MDRETGRLAVVARLAATADYLFLGRKPANPRNHPRTPSSFPPRFDGSASLLGESPL